jgi:hypothetical protein
MASWIGVVLGIIGVAIGIMGLAFAYYEHRQRTRVETIVRNLLRGVAGSVRVVFANANWADIHFRNIGYMFIEDPPDLTKIRQQAFDGARDAAACARQLGLTHLQVRGIQQSLFNDSEETLPEVQADDVRYAQRQSLVPASADITSRQTPRAEVTP